jgi:hypothetical protein
MNDQKLERKAYSVLEFCDAYRVSRSELYRMWDRGEGPKRKRFGRKKYIILIADAEAWAKSEQAKKKQSKDDGEECGATT